MNKKGVFSEKGAGNSVNGGLGMDFHRKGNSVKRSGRFSETRTLKIEKLLSQGHGAQAYTWPLGSAQLDWVAD